MVSVRRILATAAVAAALCASQAVAEFPASKMYRTVQVGEGILAFISPETTTAIPSGNVVAVIGEEGVLVVDSGRFPTLARRMIAEIRQKTDKPVRYLVRTHWHLDHVVGDEEWRAAFPGMSFVSTDFTRRKMIEKQVGYLRDVAKNDRGYIEQIETVVREGRRSDGTPLTEDDRRYLRKQAADIRVEAAELDGAEVVEPDLTFDRNLTVHLGTREVRIAFLGAGNTAGDTVVFVPDSRVAITGDLLVSPVPYGYGCHPGEWVATLKKLMATDATTIVPGHGPVMNDWGYAKKVIGVLEAIRSQVGEAVRQGASLEETRRRMDLESFQRVFAGEDYERSRAFRDFFVHSAVERAWQEAKGAMAEE